MKKRIISMGIVVLLLMMAIVPMVNATAATRDAYVKTGNGKTLNLRSGPSTNDTIIKNIPYGAIVTIHKMVNDTWAHVSYKSHDGYVMRRYLTYDKPGPKPTPKPGSGSASIAHLFNGFEQTSYHVAVRPSSPGGFVHMRWAPTKEAAILNNYHQDDGLEVIAQNHTWAQVRDPATGMTGFMMRAFLSDVGVGEGGADS